MHDKTADETALLNIFITKINLMKLPCGPESKDGNAS